MSDQIARTPFASILVANRGEIALRIIRTAKAAGLRTIAVYSSADASARHVRAADVAVRIGEAQPAKSYLNVERIMRAALETGARAIHPGYGFLSENAAFARACREAGLVFVGPSAEAIERMGDKAGAKMVMMAAGVPCVPGYQGDDNDEATLAAEAERIGFPVMIKAVAGGGGRGMRLVEDAAAFPAALRSAKSEARTAFGSDRVLLEKAIVRPRHIEIQVLADRHGNAIHLGERDCSVQRRHQKMIEETPSPFVSATLRERMGAAAVAAVKAIRYEGAGTLEFLVDASGDFYFMEMNTRLQVEHPVTEAVTGLDLVALQLRVAAGEPLGFAQADIRFDGHAIEVRLCAEDPRRDFMPQSGPIRLWRAPRGLRVEDALETGTAIPPYYDSMVAKLVSHAPTRDAAMRRLASGLDETVLLGVATNRTFLRDALTHETFASGSATTAFVADHAAEILTRPRQDEETAKAICAALVWLTRTTPPSPPSRLACTFGAPVRFALNGDGVQCEVGPRDGGTIAISLCGFELELRIRSIDASSARLQIGDVTEEVVFVRDGDLLFVQWRGREDTIADRTFEATGTGGAADGDGVLKASMSGQVIEIHAAVDDIVVPGQALVTLEAMKMEHAHALRSGGRILEIFVGKGEQVSLNQPLLRIDVGNKST